MIGICPNISHPDWINAVQAFGKDTTLLLYDRLGGRIPSPTEVEALKNNDILNAGHNQRVWDANKAEGLIDNWHTVDGKRRPVMKTFTNKAADDKVMELRRKYYKEGIAVNKGLSITQTGIQRYPIVFSDKRFITEGLAELHITRNFQRADIAAEEAAREAEIQSTPFKGTINQIEESRRLEGIQTESETKEGLQAKLSVLEKAIPGIETISDETIPSIAQADAGGKVIRINPSLLTTDSIGHEYGHILIDLLGGMNNPMIKQGRKQLEGTDIERAVLSKYQDLAAINDDRLDKEILTTAVGLKTAEIFKDTELQSKWERWLVRFLRRLRAMLGIESSVVLNLAQKLVEGQQIKSKEYSNAQAIKEGYFIQGRPSRYEQQSRKLEDMQTILDKMIQAEEKFQEKATFVLQKKLDVLSKKGQNTPEFKALEQTMPRIQGLNPTQSLIHMIRFAVSATKEMNDKYISYLKEEQTERNEGQRGKFTVKLLSEWRTSVAAWDMLEDLKQLYVDTRNQVRALGTESDVKGLKTLLYQHKDMLEATLGEKEMKRIMMNKNVNILDVLIPLLDEAINIKNTMQTLYLEKGRELIADWLAPHAKQVKIAKRAEYEQEWLNLNAEEQAKTPKEKYIMLKMTENIEDINAETRQLVYEELKLGSTEVGFITRFMDTILDSRDVVSAALAKAVFDVQEKSNREAIDWKYRFADRVSALEKQLGRSMGVPDEKFWEWMYESDPESGLPMLNIISSLPSKLIDDYNKQAEVLYHTTAKDNDGNKIPDNKKRRILAKWLEDNAPRDKEAWAKRQQDLFDDLLKEKLITSKEHKKLSDNAKLSEKTVKKDSTTLVEDQRARDVIDSFYGNSKWLDRIPAKHYKAMNAKWDALEAIRKSNPNDERVKFYDFIVEIRDLAAKKLPGKYALTTELPSMMKAAGQRYRASAGLGVFLQQELAAKFKKQSTDTERGMIPDEDLNAVGKEKKEAGVNEGNEKTKLVNEANEPIFFLPIYYTQNKAVDVGKKMPIADQSFDIASLYFNYLKMAIEFSAKQEQLAEIEMINYFISNRDIISRDAKGNINIDATHKKLKNSDKKSVKERAVLEQGNKSMLAAMVQDFIKSNYFGMEHEVEPDVTIFGYTMDRAKALDALNSFTAVNLLGVNFMAGFANLNLGEITQINEAFAGQYTTVKDLHKATKYYYKNLGGIMSDIGERRPHNIVSLLIDRFNVLNEEIDGKLNLNSKFANMMKTNTLFFTSHAGEHYMQTRFMLAMLTTMRAIDSEGNDLGSMLDNISVDKETGTLKIGDKVANFSEQDQIDFSAKMHRVLSQMHGEYTKIGQNAMQRYAIGRMSIMFRRFVVPGFKRRYEKKYANNLLDAEVEGYYRTFGRLAKLYMSDLLHFKHEAMEAFGRTGKHKLTDLERANLIRFAGEMAALGMSVVMVMLLTKAKSQDDDKDSILLNNLAYQALRLRSELAFYWNPMATLQILRSPMAAMSQIENTLKLFGQLMYPIYSGSAFTEDTPFFEVYQTGSWKGHLKLEKTFNNIIPVIKQWHRIENAGDQLSWFKGAA